MWHTTYHGAQMCDDNNVASIDAAISNSVSFFGHRLARVIHSTSVSKDKYDESDERWITLQFTWSGKPFSLEVAESDRCVPGGDIQLVLLTTNCRIECST